MAFDSLDRLINVVVNQAEWADYQRYQSVCHVWQTIISSQVAAHTRPLSTHRNILWVATSSASWAQQLSFQGYSLLKQLNTRLESEPLTNIRFSSAQWFQSQPPDDQLASSSPSNINLHPSSLDSQAFTAITATHTPQEAFQQWATMLQHRFASLPLCPQCHCPTPPGELNRWSKCAVCLSQDEL